jgi:hypothetical protein
LLPPTTPVTFPLHPAHCLSPPPLPTPATVINQRPGKFPHPSHPRLLTSTRFRPFSTNNATSAAIASLIATENGPQVSKAHPHDVRRPLKPIGSCFGAPRHRTNRPRVKFRAHDTSTSTSHAPVPTPHFHTMPPRKKPAAVVKKPAASPPPTSKVRKRGPSNADEMASKPKAKKAKNAKKATADDNDRDAGKEGGTAKPVKKTRVKKPRYVPALFITPHPTDCLRPPTRKTSTQKAAETANESFPASDDLIPYVPPPFFFLARS